MCLGLLQVGVQLLILSNPERFGFDPAAPHLVGNLIFLTFALSLIAGGTLALFLRKSGVLTIALALTIPALSLAFGSLAEVPFPWTLFNLGFAVTMLAPWWIFVQGWRVLRW